MVGNLQGDGTKGSLILVVPSVYIRLGHGRGTSPNGWSGDHAVYNPPEVLALEPKSHLVDPDVEVGPIKDGDCDFDIVVVLGRHFLSLKEAGC